MIYCNCKDPDFTLMGGDMPAEKKKLGWKSSISFAEVGVQGKAFFIFR